MKRKLTDFEREFARRTGPILVPSIISNTIYEKAFAKTDKTDAILVVQGKKLHVNKAFLSYQSEYFDTLFNSEFKEKSMEEIPIGDVDFKEFAIFLSLVHPNPLKPTEQNAEKLLELADRFLLPVAKRHLELFLLSSKIVRFEKLRIADKYEFDDLFDHGLEMYTEQKDFYGMKRNLTFKNFSDANKAKILDRLFDVLKFPTILLPTPSMPQIPLITVPPYRRPAPDPYDDSWDEDESYTEEEDFEDEEEDFEDDSFSDESFTE